MKRDKAVVPAVLTGERPTFDLLGSDVVNENDYSIPVETVAPIRGLRFVIATNQAKLDRLRQKIAGNEPIIMATSYPNTTNRELARLGIAGFAPAPFVQPGGIGALPRQYSAVDAIFELVRSGDSLRENKLEIVIDDIRNVDLMVVTKRIENE